MRYGKATMVDIDRGNRSGGVAVEARADEQR
jgi:hypothetical protein